MDLPSPLPHYEFAIEFYTTFLRLRHETGAKYLALGVLAPDAEVGENHRPLFRIDPISVERHLDSIRRHRQKRFARAHRLEVAA